MAQEKVSLLDMEARLEADESGSYRDQVLGQLAAFQQGMKRTLDSGLPPREFEVANKLNEALETAARVITAAWQAGRAQ